MTKGRKNVVFVLLGSILLLVFGGDYLVRFFSSRYLPPRIIVSKNKISSSGGFMNPITIEKLRVDSFGKEEQPTKYTIEYVTTCSISQKDGEPGIALNEVKLNEPGSYSWSGENVHISIVHPEGISRRIDSAQGLILSKAFQNISICPLKFENENWYFINFQDPVFIGVYVYIDKMGTIHQYGAYSRILP